MLRIAMVTPFPDDPDRVVGGVAGVARYLAPQLAASGACELSVLAPGAATDRTAEVEGFRVRWLARSRLPGLAAYWTEERRRIARVLDEWRPDVVHFQAVAGWGIGCVRPRVLTLHGLAERDVLYSPLPLRRLRAAWIGAIEAHARASFPQVISISPYLDETIGSQLRGRIWHIDNPIDERFFEVARRDDGRSVLFLGRIGERKNLLGALEALRVLRATGIDARLRVAGDVEDAGYEKRCRALIERHDLAPYVAWLGSLDAAGVRDELASAACLVLPSFQETAPLAIEEAMAAGVPVVAARACGIPYLVRDGETGFLAPAADSAAFATQVGRLLASAELRAAFGGAAREEASRRFRASAVAARTLDVHRAALAGAI